jgi:hypothetical protein
MFEEAEAKSDCCLSLALRGGVSSAVGQTVLVSSHASAGACTLTARGPSMHWNLHPKPKTIQFMHFHIIESITVSIFTFYFKFYVVLSID